jgi:hypothetical protein
MVFAVTGENLPRDYCPGAVGRLKELSPRLELEEGQIFSLGIVDP